MTSSTSKKILIIQTAFIGDTILASHFARAVKGQYPDSEIHFVLRKGNESVIEGLSTIHKTWIWDKGRGKVQNLLKLIRELRGIHFDLVFNLHRHFNSGFITGLVKSKRKIGFKQNPLSFFYDKKVNHLIPHPKNYHEVQRNLELIDDFKIVDNPKNYKPELPLKDKNFEKIKKYIVPTYFVVAPASVWFTKAWSAEKYSSLVKELVKEGMVYFIGAPSDRALCDQIANLEPRTQNLCGELSLLDSAASIKTATRVFVNDSAPLHLASSVNAPTTAIFCSTIKEFGYTPLADQSVVVEVEKILDCRPCGLHGYKECPKGHFKCSELIEMSSVVNTILK